MRLNGRLQPLKIPPEWPKTVKSAAKRAAIAVQTAAQTVILNQKVGKMLGYSRAFYRASAPTPENYNKTYPHPHETTHNSYET